MDPLERLCSVYQDGRPLAEYVYEFLTCSKQISLDRWTLLDCFWSGLDEEIAQRIPGPAALCLITSTWLGLSVDPVFSPSAQKHHSFPFISSQVHRPLTNPARPPNRSHPLLSPSVQKIHAWPVIKTTLVLLCFPKPGSGF